MALFGYDQAVFSTFGCMMNLTILERGYVSDEY